MVDFNRINRETKAREDSNKAIEESKKAIKEMEALTANPLDHIELTINAKNQVTGKVKVHYDGHDSRNKFTAYSEAMEIIHKIYRANNPPTPNTRTKPMHLTDKRMDYE